MSQKQTTKAVGRLKRYVIGAVFGVVIFVTVIVVDFYPFRPSSLAGWIILVAVGIPVCFCLELLAESLLSNKCGQKISDKAFSLKRILFLLLGLLLVVGLALGVALVVRAV